MRVVLFLITVSLVVVSAADEVAYVVIGATIEGSDQFDQPKWIAVTSSNQSRRTYHVPVDAIVSPLEPGRYRYFHIDFREDYTG
jgi:hypothetical protein